MLIGLDQWYNWACLRKFPWSFHISGTKQILETVFKYQVFRPWRIPRQNDQTSRSQHKHSPLGDLQYVLYHAVWPSSLSRIIFSGKATKTALTTAPAIDRYPLHVSLAGLLSVCLLCKSLNQVLGTRTTMCWRTTKKVSEENETPSDFYTGYISN